MIPGVRNRSLSVLLFEQISPRCLHSDCPVRAERRTSFRMEGEKQPEHLLSFSKYFKSVQGIDKCNCVSSQAEPRFPLVFN